MATYLDGSVRRATANTVTAMRRSAETRRCPDCGRKSALSRYTGEFVSVRYCRWSKDGLCTRTVDVVLQELLDRHLSGPEPDHDVRTIRRIRYEIASR